MMLRFKGIISLFVVIFIFAFSTSSLAATVTYTYDSLNRITKVDYGNGFTEEYTYDNAGNRLSLLVKAPLPDISVSPISYNFGSINTGSLSTPQIFTISNTGSTDLVIGTIKIKGTNASEFVKQSDLCSGQTVKAGNNCKVEVKFSPTSAGPKSASLSIPSNDPVTPTLSLTLTGTGIQAYTLIIQKIGVGSGTITSIPSGINCGNDCNENYVSGTVVTLTAIASSGSTFAGWSGDCSGKETCTIMMDSDRTITASFDIPVYINPDSLCGGSTPCYSSIQEAINVAQDGVTIKVAQGTYHENLVIDSSKNFIMEGGWNSDFTSKEEDPSLTIIDGSGSSTVFSISTGSGEVDTIAIKGFTIRNGIRGIYAYGYSSGKINLTLNGNIISDNVMASGSGGGIYARSNGSGSAVTVKLINNMIVNNTSSNRGGGVYALSENSGSTKLTLTNNTITNNSSLYGGGLYLYSSNGNTRSTVKNNIIWGNNASYGKDVAMRKVGGILTVSSSYNDIKSIYNDPAYPGTYIDLGGNINLNPLFVNPSSKDYHLTSSSPCIDRGTDEGAPLTDIDGDIRPVDGNGDTIERTDIGADEYK